MGKILFCDMDGTIIHGNKMIHELDKEKMHELRSNGHQLVFNTGRNLEEAKIAIDLHDLPHDYLVLNNGAHIIDKRGNEVFKKTISGDIGKDIIEYCIDLGVWIFFYDGKKTIGYFEGKTYGHGIDDVVVIDDYDFIKEYQKVVEFDIIAIHQDNHEIDKLLKVKEYINDKYSSYADSFLNLHYLDITACGCSKGSGIEVLKELADSSLETYCIGDSFNDISMFEVADYSYTFNHVTSDVSKHTDKQVNYVYEVIDDMLKFGR